MATRLGDVWMAFRLDTDQAQKDLDKLEVKTQAEIAKSPKKEDKGVTPSLIGKTRSETHQENYLRQLGSAVLKKAGGGLSGSPVAAVATGLTGQVAPFLPPSTQSALMTAGKVALAYGIASETMKLLPEAFSLGKVIAGPTDPFPRLNEIERTLDSMRATVVALEGKVLGIISGVGSAAEHAKAVNRLFGKLPNTEFYYRQYEALAEEQHKVDDAFENWKTKEAPFTTTRTLLDIFYRSITR